MKHTITPPHILWDIKPAHPGHPWNCHTYPTVPSLMYSYFSNVSFPSNGNAYVIHAKGRFRDRLEVRHGSIKSKSTKPRNTEEGDMCQDTQFPSLARSCHAFIDLRIPSCISLLAQLYQLPEAASWSIRYQFSYSSEFTSLKLHGTKLKPRCQQGCILSGCFRGNLCPCCLRFSAHNPIHHDSNFIQHDSNILGSPSFP